MSVRLIKFSCFVAAVVAKEGDDLAAAITDPVVQDTMISDPDLVGQFDQISETVQDGVADLADAFAGAVGESEDQDEEESEEEFRIGSSGGSDGSFIHIGFLKIPEEEFDHMDVDALQARMEATGNTLEVLNQQYKASVEDDFIMEDDFFGSYQELLDSFCSSCECPGTTRAERTSRVSVTAFLSSEKCQRVGPQPDFITKAHTEFHFCEGTWSAQTGCMNMVTESTPAGLKDSREFEPTIGEASAVLSCSADGKSLIMTQYGGFDCAGASTGTATIALDEKVYQDFRDCFAATGSVSSANIWPRPGAYDKNSTYPVCLQDNSKGLEELGQALESLFGGLVSGASVVSPLVAVVFTAFAAIFS